MQSKITAFIYPGQGSQFVGMGKELIQAYPLVKDLLKEGSDRLSLDLFKIMQEGPEDELTKTSISQPAIYLFSFAVDRLLRSLFPALTNQYAAGLSLGEYTALAGSGMMDPWEGLSLVKERGKLMGEACKQSPGTMAAVLGLSQKEIEALVKSADLPHDLWAANFNSPGQTVISGTIKGIEKGAQLVKDAGAKKVIPLVVEGAFHSGLMLLAQERLQEKILVAPIKMSDTKVVLNASGQFPKNEEEVKRMLIAQVIEPVRWQESIELLNHQGVEIFIEAGPGKTLSSLNKRIGVNGQTFNIETPADIEKFAKELNL